MREHSCRDAQQVRVGGVAQSNRIEGNDDDNDNNDDREVYTLCAGWGLAVEGIEA